MGNRPIHLVVDYARGRFERPDRSHVTLQVIDIISGVLLVIANGFIIFDTVIAPAQTSYPITSEAILAARVMAGEAAVSIALVGLLGFAAIRLSGPDLRQAVRLHRYYLFAKVPLAFVAAWIYGWVIYVTPEDISGSVGFAVIAGLVGFAISLLHPGVLACMLGIRALREA